MKNANHAKHISLNQSLAANDFRDRPRCDMEASTVNPVTEIMLVVNACKRLQQWFATHTVSAEKHHLPVDGPCYWPTESFLQDVDIRLLVIIRGGCKQHAQLAQDIVLSASTSCGVNWCGSSL